MAKVLETDIAKEERMGETVRGLGKTLGNPQIGGKGKGEAHHWSQKWLEG